MTASGESLEFLSRCELFAGAAPEDIAAAAAIAMASSWPTGGTIFQVGDPADYMIVVTAGRLRLTLASSAGKELTIRHAGPGAVVGEIGVLDREPRSATATADTATRGLVIRRPAFERLLAERPALALAVIRYLSRRLRETTFRLESATLHELSARLARFLLDAARQARGPNLPSTVSLDLGLDQSEIASILGASRPKLNQALAGLAGQGAIHRSVNRIECNVRLLGAIADVTVV